MFCDMNHADYQAKERPVPGWCGSSALFQSFNDPCLDPPRSRLRRWLFDFSDDICMAQFLSPVFPTILMVAIRSDDPDPLCASIPMMAGTFMASGQLRAVMALPHPHGLSSSSTIPCRIASVVALVLLIGMMVFPAGTLVIQLIPHFAPCWRAASSRAGHRRRGP